jgi:RNA polymerase sigma factor (sigma-70 family)
MAESTPVLTDDSRLLTSYVQEKSQAAFTKLVQRHINLVYATALRRVGGDRKMAEDVAQTVFIVLARKAPSLQSRAALAGWLYRSARFAAAQAVRTERRLRNRERAAYALKVIDAEGAIAWEKVQPVIDEAMDDLNDADRDIVALRFFKDLSLAEVGQQLGISSDAARMRVERALEKLRAALSRRGVASTTATLAAVCATDAAVAAPAGLGVQIGAHIVAAGAVGGVAATSTWLGLGKILAGCVAAAVVIAGVGVALHREHSPSFPAAPVHQEILANPSVKTAMTSDAATRVVKLSPTPARITEQNNRFVRTASPAVAAAFHVDQLDRLVSLSAEQKLAAEKIFAEQESALQQFPIEDRAEKGMSIRQNTRVQIRALLSESQQKIYNTSSQRLGGGSIYDPAAMAARLDEMVSLTEAQTMQAAAIFQKSIDRGQPLEPIKTDGSAPAAIWNDAKAELRALLTPEQQKKFDAQFGQERPEITSMTKFLVSSPAIAERLGAIVSVKPGDAVAVVSFADPQVQSRVQSRKGHTSFEVRGRNGTETLTVYWESALSGSGITVTEVDDADGKPIVAGERTQKN